MQKLSYSFSPHIRGKFTTKRIMCDVCFALFPAAVMGCVYFGLNAFFILLLSVISAVASEIIFRLVVKVPFSRIVREFDFTSVVTGMLVGMNMPAFAFSQGWFVPILSSAVAIILVKMLFGGTGRNLVNPAIVGRIFAVMSFGALMTTWVSPAISSLSTQSIVSGATPLTAMLVEGSAAVEVTGASVLDLLLGTGVKGVIGETCKVALLVGYVYLVLRQVIDWKLPLIYIGVTGLFTVVLNSFDFAYFLPSVLSGGLILGAVFMATDYVTTPNTDVGNLIYFVLLGLVTATLRVATKMEVVSFAILLCNLFVPLIDKFVVRRPFGARRKKEGAK